jgi:DNA-binding FrmR family transcriptional regulator
MGYHRAMADTTAKGPTRTAAVPAAPHAGHAAAGAGAGAHDTFRHSYSKDRTQLVRRLSRVEGQVRGIARMIERDEYCVDILQQTAALRAAVDAISILILEDHVQGCVRTAAERGEADKYVDEVIDVVRRTLGRPVRGSGRTA